MTQPLARGVFHDAPPERKRAGGIPSPWVEIADDLRAHPNEWREIAKDAPSSLATKIRSGRIAAFRIDERTEVGMFDTTTRDNDPVTKLCAVWAVYEPGRVA